MVENGYLVIDVTSQEVRPVYIAGSIEEMLMKVQTLFVAPATEGPIVVAEAESVKE
jgi:ubiquitin-protein ligase